MEPLIILWSTYIADSQADVDPPGEVNEISMEPLIILWSTYIADSQADVDPPGEVNEISMEPFELEQDDNDINFMENPSTQPTDLVFF